MRKCSWIVLSLSVIVLLFATGARADTIQFAISGGDNGDLTVTYNGTTDLISAITGTFDGSTIGTLIAVGGFGGNDNNVYPTAKPYFDGGGVSFTLNTPDDPHGDKYANLSSEENGVPPPNNLFGTCEWNTMAGCNGVVGDGGPDTITLVATPEPSTLSLLVLGIGFMFVLRRRRDQELPQSC